MKQCTQVVCLVPLKHILFLSISYVSVKGKSCYESTHQKKKMFVIVKINNDS